MPEHAYFDPIYIPDGRKSLSITGYIEQNSKQNSLTVRPKLHYLIWISKIMELNINVVHWARKLSLRCLLSQSRLLTHQLSPGKPLWRGLLL